MRRFFGWKAGFKATRGGDGDSEDIHWVGGKKRDQLRKTTLFKAVPHKITGVSHYIHILLYIVSHNVLYWCTFMSIFSRVWYTCVAFLDSC